MGVKEKGINMMLKNIVWKNWRRRGLREHMGAEINTKDFKDPNNYKAQIIPGLYDRWFWSG